MVLEDADEAAVLGALLQHEAALIEQMDAVGRLLGAEAAEVGEVGERHERDLAVLRIEGNVGRAGRTERAMAVLDHRVGRQVRLVALVHDRCAVR